MKPIFYLRGKDSRYKMKWAIFFPPPIDCLLIQSLSLDWIATEAKSDIDYSFQCIHIIIIQVSTMETIRFVFCHRQVLLIDYFLSLCQRKQGLSLCEYKFANSLLSWIGNSWSGWIGVLTIKDAFHLDVQSPYDAIVIATFHTHFNVLGMRNKNVPLVKCMMLSWQTRLSVKVLHIDQPLESQIKHVMFTTFLPPYPQDCWLMKTTASTMKCCEMKRNVTK